MTLPVNQAAQTANTIIKSIESALEPLIQNYLIEQVPALGLPVIKTITDGIENIVENALTKYIETGTDFIIIDLQTSSENSQLVSARANYIKALQSGDQAAIAAARQVYDQAISSLANDDGSGNLS